MLPGRARARTRRRAEPARRERPRADPGRAAGDRRRARRSSCSRCCARGHLSLGPRAAGVRAGFGARRRREHASAVSSGTAGAAPRAARRGRRGGRRGRHHAVQLRRVGQLVLYEGARPVFCDIDPRTLNIDPRRRPRRPSRERTTGAAAGAHLRLPGRHARARALAAERGLWIVEDACEALGASHGDGRGRRARQPGGVRLLPEQADDDGRGRHASTLRRRRSRSGSTPSATRAARPTWAGSTTTGSASTTASRTSPARSASPSSSGSTRCSPTARAVAALYSEALAGVEGLELPCPDAGGDAPRLVRLRRPAARAASTATRRSARCARAASTPSPTCRRST